MRDLSEQSYRRRPSARWPRPATAEDRARWTPSTPISPSGFAAGGRGPVARERRGRRWPGRSRLIGQFTRGDADIEQGLNQWWQNWEAMLSVPAMPWGPRRRLLAEARRSTAASGSGRLRMPAPSHYLASAARCSGGRSFSTSARPRQEVFDHLMGMNVRPRMPSASSPAGRDHRGIGSPSPRCPSGHEAQTRRPGLPTMGCTTGRRRPTARRGVQVVHLEIDFRLPRPRGCRPRAWPGWPGARTCQSAAGISTFNEIHVQPEQPRKAREAAMSLTNSTTEKRGLHMVLPANVCWPMSPRHHAGRPRRVAARPARLHAQVARHDRRSSSASMGSRATEAAAWRMNGVESTSV